MQNYDLVIIGQGSGAFAAAIKANELGIKTASIGANVTKGTVIGGTCVNVGCLPSKNMITVGNIFYQHSADYFGAIRYGRSKLDFRKVMAEKDALVKKFRKEKYRDVMKGLDSVEYIPKLGRFISSNEVKVDGGVVRGKKFIIATGARAKIPQVEGIKGVSYLTNEEALSLSELPDSMIIIGGRTLGLEFAQMYAHFGTKVTVLQRNERILPEDEPEISEALKLYLEQEGIAIHTGVSLKEVSQRGEKKVVRAHFSSEEKEFKAEQLLFATGRTPNTDYLTPERAGVELDGDGFVKVNDQMQTSASHIWAAGDVIGEPMLETIAAKEGATAVHNAFAGAKKSIDLREVPRAVFTYPEVASVGLTDAQANAQGIRCNCGILPLEMVPKAHIIGDTRGLVKIVANMKTKQIVGVHVLASNAADIIHEGVLAVKFKLTIDDIIDTVHVFPTLSESLKLAAQSFYRDVRMMSCCTE
ncbi:MAG: mercury(II) reductase [Thaumarchaeota archaeon]|nr:mercury(II) reductase [Nitrososphaerota archaeon]